MPEGLGINAQVVLEGFALGAIDLFHTLSRPGSLVFGRCARDDFDFSRKLARLEARGAVHRESSAGARIVRLTQLGVDALFQDRDPGEAWARLWDGRWRLVVFDVAESQRASRQKLRRTLRQAGLGRLQDSVWISPDPLTLLRRSVENLTADPAAVMFFEGHPFAGEADSSLVAHSWDFDRINARYREVADWHRRSPGKRTPPHEIREWLHGERAAWCAALREDPLLPSVLHPPGYLGRAIESQRAQHLRAVWALLHT